MHQFSQKAGWQTYETRGQLIRAHGQEVTPIGRVRQFTWPGGGLIWHRPVAVEVRQADGITRLPIPNLTRQITTRALVVLAIGVVALSFIQKRSMPQVQSRKRRPRQ